MSLVEEELGGPSVFKDLSKLDFDYVPEELPGREAELRRLAGIYRGLAQGASREHAFVHGPVGTGKTAVAKLLARQLASALVRQGRRMESVHINCRKRKTSGLVLLGILNHFDANYPDRGFSVGEMLRDLRKHLERRSTHLLVILDEVDALLSAEGSGLVYDLTRFNDETGPSWHGVSLLMVSQENVLARLDAAALSTFKQTNAVEVKPYGSPELEAILRQRAQLAIQPGAVDGDTLCLAADIAAAEGNARLAIEILQKAGQLADDEGLERIGPEQVRSAKAHTYSYITASKLQNLPPHVLLALLGLARRLGRDGSAYCTTGAAEEAYRLACEEHGEQPRAHTQYWKYLNQLKDGGFILSRMSGKGQAGTTQLLSIPDAPAAVVEEKVAQIVRRALPPQR
jgi:archaeal cell division control protein 6